MTKQEFISRQQILDRGFLKRSSVLLALGIGVVVGGVPFVNYLDRQGYIDRVWSVDMHWGHGALGVFLIVCFIIVICKCERRGVPCPSCSKRLFSCIFSR